MAKRTRFKGFHKKFSGVLKPKGKKTKRQIRKAKRLGRTMIPIAASQVRDGTRIVLGGSTAPPQGASASQVVAKPETAQVDSDSEAQAPQFDLRDTIRRNGKLYVHRSRLVPKAAAPTSIGGVSVVSGYDIQMDTRLRSWETPEAKRKEALRKEGIKEKHTRMANKAGK